MLPSIRGASVASLLLLATIATSVAGASLEDAESSRRSLVARQKRVPDNFQDEKQVCGHDVNKENVGDIWWKVGSTLELDTWVHSDYKSWVQRLDKWQWKKDQSDAWDCTSLPGKCGPPADCKEFFAFGQKSGKTYWIFKAVTGVHKIMNKVHEALQDDGIVLSFGLDQVISDFSGSVKDLSGIYAKLAAAFTVAAGGVAALPGPGGQAGGALTAIAGLFGLAALDAPPDPKPNVNAYLKEYFEQSQKALQNMARNLFGTGDQNKLKVDEFHGYTPRTQVGKFFDGSNAGKFLIEDVDSATSAMIENAKTNLRQAIGITVLDAQGWKLFIDPGVKNEGDCTKSGGSRIWRDQFKECWGILKWSKQSSGDLFTKDKLVVTHLPKETVDKMKNYKMDFAAVYDNAVACKLAYPNGGDRVVKIDQLNPKESKLPQCFFSIDVAKGRFVDDEYKAMDLWGKW